MNQVRAWSPATDPEEVHALLCASDRHHGRIYDSPVPRRRPETTALRVREGCVHTLRIDGRLVGMFTLTRTEPFAAAEDLFPPAERPRYLSRLAVAPDLLRDGGEMIGLQCVRRAVETARAEGADVLRSEANPDLGATVAMLRLLGFDPVGPVREDDGVRRIALQKPIRETESR